MNRGEITGGKLPGEITGGGGNHRGVHLLRCQYVLGSGSICDLKDDIRSASRSLVINDSNGSYGSDSGRSSKMIQKCRSKNVALSEWLCLMTKLFLSTSSKRPSPRLRKIVRGWDWNLENSNDNQYANYLRDWCGYDQARQSDLKSGVVVGPKSSTDGGT